ncbi:MAG: hypothetical protein SGJ27_13615 [Candidatus Melainabacteria bacterium]|nr:hypothetical protein [Candidatus Melainabacteria bacterium]
MVEESAVLAILSDMKKQQNILDNLYIAAPCSISWDSMTGDERERSCGGCSKSVYNISDMTKREAEAFLLASGTSECMRFYRRTDGTIMTDNCPRALRKLRDKCKLAAKIAVGLVAFVVSLPSAIAQSAQTRDTTPSRKHFQEVSAPNTVPLVPLAPGGEALLGGPMPLGRIMIKTPPTTNVPATNPATTASVEAKIVTTKHTLPNGKKVLLVTPDKNGKIIHLKPLSLPKHNSKLDARAVEFYSKAKVAVDSNNFQMAEFYLEKSLAMCDLQKSGDPGFRRHIEDELNKVRAQNSGACNNTLKNTPDNFEVKLQGE